MSGLTVFGKSGLGTSTRWVKRIQELYIYHRLGETDTFFSSNPHYRLSWTDPRSGLWHSLVAGKVLLQPNQMHCHCHYVNAASTSVPGLCTLSVMLSSLNRSFQDCPSVNAHKNEYLSWADTNVALDMLGKGHKKVLDWFKAGVETNNLRVPSKQRLWSVRVQCKLKKKNRTFTLYKQRCVRLSTFPNRNQCLRLWLVKITSRR